MMAYKKILYTKDEVDIVERMENLDKTFQELSANQKVPCLEMEDEGSDGKQHKIYMTESLAICEFIEEQFTRPPMMPKNPFKRQKVREVCQIINSGI